MNGLTFGNGIMTTYLLYRDLDLRTIGAIRGLASAIGIAGTCLYHISTRYLTLEATGMWSVTYQCSCLALSLAAVTVIHHETASLALLVFGVCASRLGLWVFDVAVTQLQQEQTPDGIRGLVGGVQQGMNSFFLLLSFLFPLLFPDPSDFSYFVAVGYTSVATAVLLYFFGLFIPTKRHA
jgi:iron-regulated transporter 1